MYVIRSCYRPIRIDECSINRWEPIRYAAVKNTAMDKGNAVKKACFLDITDRLFLVRFVNFNGEDVFCRPCKRYCGEPGARTRFEYGEPFKTFGKMRCKASVNAHDEGTFVGYVVTTEFLSNEKRIHCSRPGPHP